MCLIIILLALPQQIIEITVHNTHDDRKHNRKAIGRKTLSTTCATSSTRNVARRMIPEEIFFSTHDLSCGFMSYSVARYLSV